MIETERLRMVKAKERDILAIISMEQSRENRDYIWSGSYEEHLFEIKDPDHLLLLIIEASSDKTVGYVLTNFDSVSNKFEIRRIVISKKGIGYGKESMKALIKYAFEETLTNRLWLDVYPDNTVGIKLYENLGLHKDGILRQNYKSHRGYLDQIVYSLLKEEYKDWKANIYNT